MDRISAQPQVNLNLLRSNSLKFQVLDIKILLKSKTTFVVVFFLPLVGGVFLPGLPKLELSVCGLERAACVQRDQIAGLSDLLGGVDGASDLRKK
jgi:hypothetical protein